MAVYVDAGGSPSELVVAPAAMVATPDSWLHFEKEWNACLESYKVTSLYMKHFAHSRGEYEGWKNDQPKRRNFLNSLMWIIEDHIDFSATEAVYMAAFDASDEEYQLSEVMRPYTMGCLSVAGRIFHWGSESGLSRSDFVWLFEKGDADQSDLRKSWEIAYPDMAVEPIFLKKMDRYPDPNVCKRQRPFEAADFVAYENLKAHALLEVRGDEPLFEHELRRPLQRMKAWPGAEHWGYFGSDGIARVCDRFGIPKRAV